MTLARRLYGRFRQLIHEGTKFLVVGGIGLVVTNGAYGLLHGRGVGPVTSATIATIIASIVTYVGNRYWSFRHRERSGVAREGVTFLVLNGVGILIQDAAVAFNAYVLGLPHNKLAEVIALNTGIALATVFRFLSYRRWVWQAPAAPPAGAPAVPARPDGGRGDTGRPASPLPPLMSPNGHLPGSRGANGTALDEADQRTANRG
ncbi:MAG TPA: GtrA family protein [Streptosporangiaceae bacterium]|nr:GtrA family protein [Streptosporangiaceae bacterium]